MANEKRLIDANALVPYLWALYKFFGSSPCTESDKATQRGIKRCIGEIKKMPTVDAVEVVHGTWLDWQNNPVLPNLYYRWWKCSECGHQYAFDEAVKRNYFASSYCPNCGADMRERKDND